MEEWENMSRRPQLVWPAIAMVMSFVAVFALTLLASTPKSSSPSDKSPTATASSQIPGTSSQTSIPAAPPDTDRLVVTLVPRPPTPGQESVPSVSVVVGILEVQGGQLCQVESFAKEWRPEDDDWSKGPKPCRGFDPNKTLELRFV